MKTKQKGIIFSIVFVLLLSACAGKETEPPENVRVTEGQESEENVHSEAEETEEIESIESQTEGDTVETIQVLVENPSLEYYLASEIFSEEEMSLTLEQLTQETNEITDTEAWFSQNGLSQIDTWRMEDETYRYEITGDDGSSGYFLHIYRKEDNAYLYCLDFSDYRYAGDFIEADRDFIEQRIWWAQTVDDILYVAIGHNTYTKSAPSTGYLVAIGLNDMSVIWKSEPCVTNARTFEIIDNTIICGYGFTDEPDYLNLINRLDGSLVEKIPIKSMAEYIICKDDILFVRTYNTNYTFQICRMVVCK
ncbi:MAG: hypothetical protein J1F41_00935 [Lachnospiraceae bacterium]|nr:hypothetical protein [Lachnospiraceae bacterium]